MSKIVLLVGPGESSRYLYNFMKKKFPELKMHVICESKQGIKKTLSHRIRKQGVLSVLGQVLFMISIPKVLRLVSRKRICQLKQLYELNDVSFDTRDTDYVTTVNDRAVRRKLQEINPDLVIVNGTRIIKNNILASVGSPFINTHVGITPQYRGVHGGYWSLVNHDQDNCGVTIHFVDSGVDTGGIIAQKRIEITQKDSFVTYPLIQLGEALPELMRVIQSILNQEDLHTMDKVTASSRQYYHPTVWFYFYNRVFRGIK